MFIIDSIVLLQQNQVNKKRLSYIINVFIMRFKIPTYVYITIYLK
ncbi:putative membrane protein [Bacteroides fragilis str. 3397 N2]